MSDMKYIKSNVNDINKNSISFKGLKGEFNKDLKPVYRFTVPPHNPIKEKVILEVAIPDFNEKTNTFDPVDMDGWIDEYEFKGEKTIDIRQDEMKDLTNGFAYRYKIIDKHTDKLIRYATDEFKTINIKDQNNKMNFIEIGADYGITPKTGNILDVFKDSGAILKNGELQLNITNFCRNNFNKLGGSIKGLLYLLLNTDELDPYRYIKTTPDAGLDEMSSHGYWPENYYQCPDKKAMDDFTFELFKRGKGYIADGAYTSMSFQSPYVHHVLKYWKDSPYFDMLKLDKKSDFIELGILPDAEENYANIGVRIVNKKGSVKYDPTKPTYIQFFDKRLIDENADQLKDTTKLIKNYDKELEDIYEINSERNSVRLAYFEIDPDSPKLDVFNVRDYALLNDVPDIEEFLTFPHFKIVRRMDASGASFWDGNTDMIKMNLSNPNRDAKNIQGRKDAKEFILGAVEYWTKTTKNNLIYNAALLDDKELETTAYKNNISIDEFRIIKDNIENNRVSANNIKESIANPNNIKSIKQYIKDFPLQTIEVSNELIPIISSKEFKNMLYDEKTLTKISEIIENEINTLTKGKDSEYRAYVTELTIESYIRNLISGALDAKAIKEDGTINTDRLRKITSKSLYSFRIPINTCQDEERQAARAIKSKINPESVKSLTEKIKKDISNITLQDFQLAEAIILKGKCGLNWRFDAAKDISDLDEVRSSDSTFDKLWNGDEKREGTFKFWQDVTKTIRKINPSAYIINEITSLWDFFDSNHPEKFDRKLAGVDGMNPDMVESLFIERTNSTTSSNYSKGFNTFSFFAGVDPENGFWWNEVEDIEGVPKNFGNIATLKNAMDNYNKNAAPNTGLLVHNFFENYDKPRILHLMPLDSMLFFADGKQTMFGNHETLQSLIELDSNPDEKRKRGKENINYRETIEKATGGRTDYDNISSKAVAVSDAIRKIIDRKYNDNEYTDIEYERLIFVLQDLTNGCKKPLGNPDFARAEKFATTPYEISIKDLHKRAKINVSQKEVDDFCYELLEDSICKQERLWQILNCMSGATSLYDGMQFGQTGFESASKNLYQGNRNPVYHYRREGSPFSKNYNKLNAINSLYLQDGMSAIKNGAPVSCDITHPENFAYSFWPIVKYDEFGSTVLSIVSDYGFKKGSVAIKEIKVSKKEGNDEICPLPDTRSDGSELEFRRKVYDENKKCYVDETYKRDEGVNCKKGQCVTYVIDSDTNCLKRKDGKPIIIDDTTMQFYIPDAKLIGKPKPRI